MCLFDRLHNRESVRALAVPHVVPAAGVQEVVPEGLAVEPRARRHLAADERQPAAGDLVESSRRGNTYASRSAQHLAVSDVVRSGLQTRTGSCCFLFCLSLRLSNRSLEQSGRLRLAWPEANTRARGHRVERGSGTRAAPGRRSAVWRQSARSTSRCVRSSTTRRRGQWRTTSRTRRWWP